MYLPDNRKAPFLPPTVEPVSPAPQQPPDRAEENTAILANLASIARSLFEDVKRRKLSLFAGIAFNLHLTEQGLCF